MQALASLFICGQRVAVQDVNGQKVTLTGLLTAHTALLKSHCRLRQCSLLCLCAPFPRGYTISRGVPGNCTFEITLLQAIMFTLLLVCAFSPRVHSIPRGSPFLKLTTKRHKVTVKINTLHNARKRKRFPNANLWLGSLPRKSQTKNAQPIWLCVFCWWTLTDSFNSGTGEFTRKVERQRVAVQGDSPRKFICAEDVDGQKNNAIV